MREHTLSSIEKAILLLEQLSQPPCAYKVMDLANILQLNRSSVYRILQVLKSHDLVSLDPQNDLYRVGLGMYHIGQRYLQNDSYLTQVHDLLVELSEETKESVGMAVRDGDKIISLFEVEVHQPMKLNDLPGRYFPPNKGCYGKCLTAYQPQECIDKILEAAPFEKTLPNTLTTREELLAEYDTIRRQGYCLSVDEQGIDIIAVGIPIFGARGKMAACVAVAFFRRDGWELLLEELKRALLAYQQRLERFFP